MPRRKPAYRRVTPLASRRETQRRAAMAVIALLVVVGGLALSVWAFGGQRQQQAISSVNAGQDALDAAKANLALVSGPGIDLVADDPEEAERLLTEAYAELDKAKAARISDRVIAPLRADVIDGLDRLYGVVEVTSTDLFNFRPAEGDPAFDLVAMVRGPDDMPYVIDATTKTVYRVDLKRKRANAVAREGSKVGDAAVAEPRFLAVGVRDLLILDAKNVLWRWRPSNDAGKGTLNRVNVNGATQWGDDITAIGTYVRNRDAGLYNLYVVDPSEQQIRAYPPAQDGSGFPARSSGWLATARDVDSMVSMYIDGDIYVVEAGLLERFTAGKSGGWDAAPIGDELLRDAPEVSLVAGFGDRGIGRVYAYDRPNDRIVAYDKDEGGYVAQYRLAGDDERWSDLRAMYVLAGVEDAPATVVWLSPTGVHQSVLEAAPDGVAGSPEPPGSADPSAGASPDASPSP